MSRRFGNNRKDNFIVDVSERAREELAARRVEHVNNDISERMKFNFSFFCPERPGYDFTNMNKDELVDFYHKLHCFGRESIQKWRRTPIGKKSGHVYELYGSFPRRSAFSVPEHVPLGVEWGRFRLDYSTRLAGFTIADNLNGKAITRNGRTFHLDSNTFYVVFLDLEHKFYLTS